jgi:hypothetical protein
MDDDAVDLTNFVIETIGFQVKDIKLVTYGIGLHLKLGVLYWQGLRHCC